MIIWHFRSLHRHTILIWECIGTFSHIMSNWISLRVWVCVSVCMVCILPHTDWMAFQFWHSIQLSHCQRKRPIGDFMLDSLEPYNLYKLESVCDSFAECAAFEVFPCSSFGPFSIANSYFPNESVRVCVLCVYHIIFIHIRTNRTQNIHKVFNLFYIMCDEHEHFSLVCKSIKLKHIGNI